MESILLISRKITHFAVGIPVSIVVFNNEPVNCSIESDIRGTVSLGKKEAHSVLKCNLHKKIFNRHSNNK